MQASFYVDVSFKDSRSQVLVGGEDNEIFAGFQCLHKKTAAGGKVMLSALVSKVGSDLGF